MKKGFLFSLLVFLAACQSEAEFLNDYERAENPHKYEINQDTITPDIDFQLTGPIIDSILLSKFNREFQLPFHLDTNQMMEQRYDNDRKQLTLSDYTSLTVDFSKNIRSERNDWYLDQMVKFQKMSKSQLQDYEDQLDIGQLALSKIYPYGKLKISDSTQLLIWYMRHRTMQACPYGFGQVFYGTLITSNHIQCSMPIAEYSGGGDPPIGGEVKMDFLVNEQKEIIQIMTDVFTDEMEISPGDYDLKTVSSTTKLKGFISRDTVYSDDVK
jgi:hypothetical protein